MITLCGASLGPQAPSHLSPGLGRLADRLAQPGLYMPWQIQHGVELAESWKSEAWDALGWDSLWAARESETRAAPCLPASRPPGKGSRGPRYLSPCLPLGPHASRLWGKLPQMGGRRSTDAIRHVCLARFIASSPSPARGPSPRRPVLAWLLMAPRSSSLVSHDSHAPCDGRSLLRRACQSLHNTCREFRLELDILPLQCYVLLRVLV